MDIAESRLPQDGGFDGSILSLQDVEFRIATYPTLFGESLVIRILYKDEGFKLAELGLNQLQLKKISTALNESWGLLLVTGPTGSGKTTSLYALIRDLMSPDQLVVTVEDPVEKRIKNIRQSQINRKAGFTFAKGIKHALRQDPDILMVGEIRDSETAIAAVQSAMTGHVCLSSLHTNDSISTVERLLDLGLERYQVAVSLKLVIAQRLIRIICKKCHGKGCIACHTTGFAGRTAIFEILVINNQIVKLIRNGDSFEDIRQVAIETDAIIPFEDDAKNKIAANITTVDEIQRWLNVEQT